MRQFQDFVHFHDHVKCEDPYNCERYFVDQIRESKSLIIPGEFDDQISSKTDLHLESLKIGFVPDLQTRYNRTDRAERNTRFEDVIKRRSSNMTSKNIHNIYIILRHKKSKREKGERRNFLITNFFKFFR